MLTESYAMSGPERQLTFTAFGVTIGTDGVGGTSVAVTMMGMLGCATEPAAVATPVGIAVAVSSPPVFGTTITGGVNSVSSPVLGMTMTVGTVAVAASKPGTLQARVKPSTKSKPRILLISVSLAPHLLRSSRLAC